MDRPHGKESDMGGTVGRFRDGALVLIALGLLAGCAASRGTSAKEEPAGISVHLPAAEPMDIETRTQPPVVDPVLNLPPPQPSDAHEEGKARSLDLIDIHLDSGKPHKPAGSVPPDESGKP
ncbi:MAG TPA: hypothetical protein VF853_08050 [Candidatus Deferrimicrobiaceae bacterium]